MIIDRILFSPISNFPWLSAIFVIVVFSVLLVMTWRIRHRYLRYLFFTKENRWVLLEIKLPQEIRRSPAAMEQFLTNGIWWGKGGGSNFYKKYWQGEALLTFSLEIASIGGSLHFFIQTPAHMRDMVQTQLYAQYPQVEIQETVDYVDRIPFAPNQNRDSNIGMFLWDYRFSKPDALPIKTYKQFGFDKQMESLDPDQQIDPLIPLIERLASVDPWEEFWIQFVVRASREDDWRQEGQKMIDDLIADKRKTKGQDDESGNATVFLTPGEKNFIETIERNTDLPAFEVGIRSCYLTHNVGMFKVNRVSYQKELFSSFNTKSYNSIKGANPPGPDNPWEDYDEFFENVQKDRMLEKYRAREVFGDKPVTRWTFPDIFLWITGRYKQLKPMIFTTEELATVFHLPSGYETAKIDRADTTKAKPPANLPIA